MTGLLLALAACAGAADTVDAIALRGALASELRAQAGDMLGWEASDLLLGSSITLRLGATPPGPDGRPATASYTQGSGEIVVAESLAREKDAPAVARRIAPTVLHELEHARADFAAPGAPVVLEGELAAYAAEAVFVRRRLSGDPAYLKAPGLGRLRANYEFLVKPGGLEELREACRVEGLLRGLPKIAPLCGKLKPAERKACEAATAYYRGRLAELTAALQPAP